MSTSSGESPPYTAVVNDEGQYSIWPVERQLPAGWRREGAAGTEEECLAYIEEVWTDMRPLSLRQKMDRSSGAGGDDPPEPG